MRTPASCSTIAAEGAKQNEAVHTGLAGLSVPLAALNEARSKRDASIPNWEKHYRRLKDAAKVAYRDEAGRFEALFAEPDAVLTHPRPKARKAKAAAVAPAEGGTIAPVARKTAKAKQRRGR